MPRFGSKEENTAENTKRILPNFRASKFKAKLEGTKIKGTLKCLTWVKKKIKKKGAIFPLFMILVNTIYLAIGGIIFMSLERSPKAKIDTSKDLIEIFSVLKRSYIGNLSFPDNVSSLDMVGNLTTADLHRFEKLLSKIHVSRALSAKPQWNILNSIYFCMTVTTTIGYGSLAPVTVPGRVICVIYALLGIPLTLALLAVVGKIVGDYINDTCALVLKWFRHLYPDYEYENMNQNQELGDGQIDAPLWLGLLILFIFTTITAGLCCWMEGWDFGTSFYFQFVTYLTIGFGDVVPTSEKYTFVYILLTLLGLSVLSVTLSLIATNLHHQVQKANFLEKLKQRDISTTASVGSGEESGDEEYDSTRRRSGYQSDEDSEQFAEDATKYYGAYGDSGGTS
ncbi:predicted protein [Nematostella vectensis]|uniref:Potassium channel domain-containing protein n=1 Tax=Nematostella vectensis TaxID=45351 RepID=A7RYH6_NEMVE|nr:predicted protein [Nematostella vectensis]|eukprot:XP_001635527.1 predicted protein [Nematostella vectensis]